MTNSLRDAWTNIIHAGDYESHMAAVGQAQANAQLVESYFSSMPLISGDSILFLGAGTGQMFTFVSPAFLLPYRPTFTDINSSYLELLRERLQNVPGLEFKTVIDDVERSTLSETFPLVVVVLLLEHVDWRKALATICSLSSASVLVVIQENPATLPVTYTPSRETADTMNIFSEVHPTLVPRAELNSEFAAKGFRENYFEEKIAAAGKKMLALGFECVSQSIVDGNR
jgi:hypothetical protein